MKTLTTKPDVAPAGAALTVSGTGLPALEGRHPRLDDGEHPLRPRRQAGQRRLHRPQGRQDRRRAREDDDERGRRLQRRHRTPVDFEGLHDLYAVVDGLQVAKGGFLLERKVTISPKRGPVGTPITVKVVGMGSPTYESVGGVLYDNRYTGAVSANTTRGVSTFTLRATGLTRHTLDRVRRLQPHGAVPEHAPVSRPVD